MDQRATAPDCRLATRIRRAAHVQPRARKAGLGDVGLSMVEMVVGVQLFAICALAAVPGFAPILRGYYLRGATRQVYADLQKARMAAVMENHRYRFIVLDDHTYAIHADVNNNGTEDVGETVLVRDLHTDSPGVRLAGSGTITFAANGTAPSVGTITASSDASPTHTASVTVNPAGRVRID